MHSVAKNPFTECCCLTAPVHRQPVIEIRQSASSMNSDRSFETPTKIDPARSSPENTTSIKFWVNIPKPPQLMLSGATEVRWHFTKIF